MLFEKYFGQHATFSDMRKQSIRNQKSYKESYNNKKANPEGLA